MTQAGAWAAFAPPLSNLPVVLAPARAPAPAWLALGWVLLASAAACWWLAFGPSPAAPVAAMPQLLLAAVLLPALALWWTQRAAQQGGWALALLVGAIVLCSDAGLRGGQDSGLDLQSVAKFGLWLLGLLMVLWRADACRQALARGPSAWLALFGLWCLASTAWSATPAYTAGAAVAWLGLWVAAAVLAARFTAQRATQVLAAALALAMLLSLLLLALAPGLALSPMDNGLLLRLSGIFASPNNLGRAAALLVLLAALAWPASRGAPRAALLLAAGLGMTCLVLSESRGSMAALAAALLVATLLQRPRAVLAGVLVAAAVGLAVALAAALEPQWAGALLQGVSRSGHVDELRSFTGRTDIWAATGRLIEQAPWLGHGFASSREVLPAHFQGAYGWTTTSAHNLWLQGWLTTGAVGLALVLAAQAAWLRQALRQPCAPREAVVVFVLVVGLLEAGALGPSVNVMSFIWLWAMALGVVARAPAGGGSR